MPRRTITFPVSTLPKINELVLKMSFQDELSRSRFISELIKKEAKKRGLIK